jgi:hypothetical protein
MLIAKPSDFVKSFDFKDISETNVSKLGEHFKTLSVKERRENLVFLIDDFDFDIAANQKWLVLYKEDMEYIMQENEEALEEDNENIQQTYEYIVKQSQAYKDWMNFFGYKIDEKLKIVYDTLSKGYSKDRICLMPNVPNSPDSLSFTECLFNDVVEPISESQEHEIAVNLIKKIATVILHFEPELHFDYDLSQEKQELDSLIQKHQSGDNNEFIAIIESFLAHREFLYKKNVALSILDFAQMNDEGIFMSIESTTNDLWKKFNRSVLSEFDEQDVLYIDSWNLFTCRAIIISLIPTDAIMSDYLSTPDMLSLEANENATKESFAMLVNFVRLLKYK